MQCSPMAQQRDEIVLLKSNACHARVLHTHSETTTISKAENLRLWIPWITSSRAIEALDRSQGNYHSAAKALYLEEKDRVVSASFGERISIEDEAWSDISSLMGYWKTKHSSFWAFTVLCDVDQITPTRQAVAVRFARKALEVCLPAFITLQAQCDWLSYPGTHSNMHFSDPFPTPGNMLRIDKWHASDFARKMSHPQVNDGVVLYFSQLNVTETTGEAWVDLWYAYRHLSIMVVINTTEWKTNRVRCVPRNHLTFPLVHLVKFLHGGHGCYEAKVFASLLSYPMTANVNCPSCLWASVNTAVARHELSAHLRLHSVSQTTSQVSMRCAAYVCRSQHCTVPGCDQVFAYVHELVAHVHDHMSVVGLLDRYQSQVVEKKEYHDYIRCDSCQHSRIFFKSAEARDLHLRFFHQLQWTERLMEFGSPSPTLDQLHLKGFELGSFKSGKHGSGKPLKEKPDQAKPS